MYFLCRKNFYKYVISTVHAFNTLGSIEKRCLNINYHRRLKSYLLNTQKLLQTCYLSPNKVVIVQYFDLMSYLLHCMISVQSASLVFYAATASKLLIDDKKVAHPFIFIFRGNITNPRMQY